MIPDNYLLNIACYEKEILSTMKESDEDYLKKKGSSVSKELGLFYRDNFQEIIKYIAATPVQRSKKKKWNTDYEYSLYLKTCAIYYIRIAAYLGDELLLDAHNISNGRQTVSYRHFAARLCYLVSQIRHQTSGILPLFEREKAFPQKQDWPL
jgi:hypothetical protein